MTITPVRLLQIGEPGRQPSTLNRPMQDVLSGSDYLADGSDFAGFAKKGAIPGPTSFERTLAFTFGDGAVMAAPGAIRFLSIGIDYTPVAWRIRAWDANGNTTAITAAFRVYRIGWDDSLIDLVGAGTNPFITAALKNRGDPDDWTGGDGVDGDHVKVVLASVTPLSATQITLTIDVVPV